jgi:hypothetical protein
LNPAFPVLANELVNHLASGGQSDALHHVGDDLVVTADEKKYEPSIRFRVPGRGTERGEVPVDATANAGVLSGKLDDVAASGVYEAQLQPREGNQERRPFAVNVPQGEGDLAVTPREELARQLAGVDLVLHDAADMTLDPQQLAGFQMRDALLGTIILLLLGEQLLAYAASFHVSPVRGPHR